MRSAWGHQRRLSDVLRMSALPLIPDVSLRCRERSKRANSGLRQRDEESASRSHTAQTATGSH
jgi:hypothetical protein